MSKRQKTENDSHDNVEHLSFSSALERPDLMKKCYILLPRKNRLTIVISIPDKIEINLAIKSINSSLQKTYDNSLVSILESKHIDHNNIDNVNEFKVIFLIIPNELIDKLKKIGCQSFQAFIGFSEDQTEYKLINKEPDDKDIAFENYDNQKCPFKSSIYTLD